MGPNSARCPAIVISSRGHTCLEGVLHQAHQLQVAQVGHTAPYAARTVLERAAPSARPMILTLIVVPDRPRPYAHRRSPMALIQEHFPDPWHLITCCTLCR